MESDLRNDILIRAGLDKNPDLILAEWGEQRQLIAQRQDEINREVQISIRVFGFLSDHLISFRESLCLDEKTGLESVLMILGIDLILSLIAGGIYALLNYFGAPWLLPAILLALPVILIAALMYGEGWDYSFSYKMRKLWKFTKNVFRGVCVLLFWPPLFVTLQLMSKLSDWRLQRHDELSKERDELWQQSKTMSALKSSEIVTQTYLRGLNNIREECLGPSSKVRRSQHDLRTQLESIACQREQVKARLKSAEGDQERSDTLWQAREKLKEREVRILKAEKELEQFIASTQAFFAECEARVRKIGHTVDDAELLKQIEVGAERDEALLAQSQQAIRQTLDGLNESLLSFMVSANQLSAPPVYTAGDALLEDWISQTEAAAKRIADIRRLRKLKTRPHLWPGLFVLSLRLSTLPSTRHNPCCLRA